MKHNIIIGAAIVALTGLIAASTQAKPQQTKQSSEPSAIAQASFAMVKSRAQKSDESEIAQHIATFDDLDFNVFTNQKWSELEHSHAQNVIVHWPDGRVTKGIDTHIKDLKGMFVFAPDTRILEHPIKIGQGDYTSVVGVFEGTFTKPMPTPGGKNIAPTGKAFKILMCTVGHWKNGVMDEEYLFWDNAAFAKQIGLTK